MRSWGPRYLYWNQFLPSNFRGGERRSLWEKVFGKGRKQFELAGNFDTSNTKVDHEHSNERLSSTLFWGSKFLKKIAKFWNLHFFVKKHIWTFQICHIFEMGKNLRQQSFRGIFVVKRFFVIGWWLVDTLAKYWQFPYSPPGNLAFTPHRFTLEAYSRCWMSNIMFSVDTKQTFLVINGLVFLR